jgi:hypothetical protein
MSKRINVADSIEALADFAAGDLELKARNLAKIPAPKFVEGINWSLVYSDRGFNVRDDSSYDYKENEALYHSLMDRGLEMRGSDNMSYSLQPDGRYLIIGGNIRYAMMLHGRNETVKARQASGEPTTDDNPLPFENLFGLVFEGLSRDQETDLMADHLMKKGLNEFELCKEIGESCHRLKLTDEKAAIKFGLKKSSIGRLRMRYNMPTVLSEYRKEKSKDDIPFVKVGQKALTHLYSCYYADQQSGCPFRTEGVNFRLAWNEHLRNPESTGTKPEKPKGQDRDTILNQAKSLAGTFGNNPEIQASGDILAWAANETRDGKPVALQSVLMALRDYCDKLRSERDSAIGRVVDLNSEVATVKADLESVRKDLDGITNERDELRAEVEKLKARPAKSAK